MKATSIKKIPNQIRVQVKNPKALSILDLMEYYQRAYLNKAQPRVLIRFQASTARVRRSQDKNSLLSQIRNNWSKVKAMNLLKVVTVNQIVLA